MGSTIAYIVSNYSLCLEWYNSIKLSLTLQFVNKLHQTICRQLSNFHLTSTSISVLEKQFSRFFWHPLYVRPVFFIAFLCVLLFKFCEYSIFQYESCAVFYTRGPRTLPRAGCPAKLSDLGEKGLSQGGDQEHNGHSDRAPACLCGERKPLLSRRHTDWTLWPEWQASCVEETRHRSSPGKYHPYIPGGDHAVGMFFSSRNWKSFQDGGKDESSILERGCNVTKCGKSEALWILPGCTV